jgi:addiction module RelB/DinJ family antitoxin
MTLAGGRYSLRMTKIPTGKQLAEHPEKYFKSTIQVRIDGQTKHRANFVLKRLGIDMSTAVILFINQIVETRSIPFNLKTRETKEPPDPTKDQAALW